MTQATPQMTDADEKKLALFLNDLVMRMEQFQKVLGNLAVQEAKAGKKTHVRHHLIHELDEEIARAKIWIAQFGGKL